MHTPCARHATHLPSLEHGHAQQHDMLVRLQRVAQLDVAQPAFRQQQPRAGLPCHHFVPQPVTLQRQLLGSQVEQLRRHLQ